MSSLTAEEQRRVSLFAHETPLSRGLTRLAPRDGLVVDAGTWDVAHTYHDETSQVHNLAAHGAGILTGLEVVPAGRQRVAVLPGVALDESGNVLIVPAPIQLTIDASHAQSPLVYIVVLRADEEPDEDGRVHEETSVQALTTLPDEPHIELGRLVVGAQATIAQPKDARRPAAGEIDGSYRQQAGGHAHGSLAIAEVDLTEDASHALVGSMLARAINQDGGYRARFLGNVALGSALPNGGILYATGDAEFALNEDAVIWLRDFLDTGGTIVGDSCHDTPADPFGTAFDRLAKVLGRQLRRVQPGDRMLWSHHAFGAPPPGRVKTDVGLVLADNGIIYCASDYGCVLRGGADTAVARPVIHAVEEFATNLAALAYERSRASAFAE